MDQLCANPACEPRAVRRCWHCAAWTCAEDGDVGAHGQWECVPCLLTDSPLRRDAGSRRSCGTASLCSGNEPPEPQRSPRPIPGSLRNAEYEEHDDEDRYPLQ